MKHFIKIMALAAALCVGWAANAQSSLAGYDFVTSTSANKWLALSSTTNLLTSSGDGVASTLQNIGFTFPFGGNTYTQFSVNSDGNLRLGGTQTGTGSYDTPFSSSRASYNNPKINFFGCDGYCVAGTHYVHAQNFTSSSGLNYLVVEFCLGTYASATQNVQYKWQVQLCENGNIVVAYPSTAPSQGPAVARQMGLCVDNQDGWIINSSNSATHFTNGVDTNTWSSGSWPNASRYYVFYRDNCTTIPNSNYSLYPSDTWNTHSSATDPFNAYCHKKVYRVDVIPGFRYTFKTGCDNGATADFDTYLELFNSSGTRLDYNDDSCGSQSKIEYLANSREYLYLVVRGYRESNTGSYTLAYKQAFNPTYYSITPTSSYQTHSFTTSSTNSSKIYRFYVSSDDVSNGRTFFFKTSCGNGASADFDTYMEIRNANGTQLTSNDDGSCGNTGSYIAYQPTQSGYLFLTVRGFNNATGSYTLAYKKGCVDIPDYHYYINVYDSWSTHSSQTSSGSCTDYKIYKTWVNEGYTYTFKTGCGDGATADFDTYLALYDTNDTRIAYNDDGCESLRSKLVYCPTQSGYVYLKVRGTGSSTVGSYTLAFKRETAFHITANANPTTGGWIYGNNGIYANGQTCYLDAIPSPGYQFTNWTEGSTVVSTDYNYSFTVTADRTLTANFTPTGNCQLPQEEVVSNLYYDQFDHYTTSTTAKTGVEPPCWTLVPLDVPITDAYKPMIYYSPDNALNGNYSLILNKRCIYAMPYVKNVNRCRLYISVKQPQTEYQLEVGVMSDLNDASTFVPIDTINNTGTGYNVDYEVLLYNPNIQGHYIAFRNTLAEGYTGDYSVNYIDELLLNSYSCGGISGSYLPYTNHFDRYTTSTTAKTGEEPPCWQLVQEDVTMADEYKPMIYYSSTNAHSGNYSLILNKRGIYRMPYSYVKIDTLQLDFYLKQTQAKYQLQVGVCDYDGSNFTPVATINNSSTNYEHVTVNFSSYTGTNRYIAFRNILAPGQTGDFSINYIDDLVLNYRPATSCPAITPADLPYTDNFDSYTTSTTAKTGVEVPCWTLAHQDVSMTDEYKPMIYYSSAHSHSGNYSIILNKRGIFAMPEFDGDVSTLQLSFYVRQTMAKYQLQVGVMSDLSNASTFVPVATINNSSTTASVLQTVDFTSYSGSGRYIAFRNVLASGQSGDYSCNYIDDITLELRPSSCPAISAADLPYTENFDSYTTSTTAKTGVEVPCWTLAHQDVTMTDEYKPMVYYSSAHSHSGNYSIILNKRGIFAMPEFDGDVSSLQLSFYVRQTMAKYQLQVGVMSDLSNASSFVPVATINNSSTTASVLQTVDFASYSGSGRYIAFRNVLASGQSGDYSCNYIDDITLSLRPSSCPAITATDLPYTENFDSYTTSTTAKTGVEVPCWTLAHQDVSMTDEYKPMVYYSSAHSHSGSYSIILNKRGIFAMPEFDGDVSSLQLSFYVRQTQAKYQLQVGVMSDLSNAGTFVPIATINNSSTSASVLQNVDFASYSGSGRYIAFRNVLASGQSGDYSCNYIDDILLELRPSSCPAITAADLPYSDNFDSYTTSTTAKTGVEVPCWTLAHQDVTMTDEYKPMVYYSSAHSHSGSYSIILNKRGIFAMPEFDGDVSSLQLSFYVRQTMAKYQLQVGVMSDLSNASTFVPVATINNSSTTASVLQTVDFASYSGSGRYIAFRNILASGQSGDYSCNYIDDILLELRPSSCPAITATDLPYTENFDSYTTSTTAKTGVEVPCWTLAHQDVTMADEYKPMVYYSSAHSHSGSYSIILNKRGIFAMPEFDGDVSTLQLSFYVRQTMSKYQLQVGVMSDLSNASSFVPVATINNSSTTASVLQTVDFASYSGSGRYIAFRNVLASGQSGDYSCNYIDDIRLETRCAIYPDELPYSDNFDTYTSSTTDKTGVSVPCWTLAHQDVAMTDEYKPMVYYSSAQAHSGNYSIILNKRCIFAMPQYLGNVRDLQLTFYLCQTQAKYQLQVGVMSDLSNASTFVPVATFNNSSTTASVLRTVNFSAYTGSGHYIAFRNVLASGQTGDYSCNYIDDITLSLAASKGLDGNGNDVSDNEPLSQKWMTVFPNPTSGMISIEADGEIERIDIFDYTGRCVATVEHQTSVDLSGFASGLYTLRCTLPDRIEVRRVVKQ